MVNFAQVEQNSFTGPPGIAGAATIAMGGAVRPTACGIATTVNGFAPGISTRR
jgi:hypothetical protein